MISGLFLKKFRSHVRCKTVYFFDLVHDQVKNRLLTPLLIVFILFSAVGSIFASIYIVISIPQYLDTVIPPPRVMTDGQVGTTFILQIKDQSLIPIAGLQVYTLIQDLIVKYDNEMINCDFSYMDNHFWSNQYIRNLGPCSAQISGNIEYTELGGFAYFRNFSFKGSPQGNYQIYFQVRNTSIISSLFDILLSPSIHSIKILNNPPQKAEVKVPLTIQPKLILIDLFGNPLSGSFVYAVSWPFSDFRTPFIQLFDPDIDKFAILLGSTSQVSKENGESIFSNLTIAGSTHQNVYIIFIPAGNNKIIPWRKGSNAPESFLKIKFGEFIYPIQINYMEPYTIDFIHNLSLVNKEGVSFIEQPIIQVIGNNSKQKINDLVCFALMKEFNNFKFSLGYQPHVFGAFDKYIQYAITGEYSRSSNISLSLFKPQYTNNMGIVEFQNLGISREGTNYVYQSNVGILFYCGNQTSSIKRILLNSSVKSIEILTFPIFFDELNLDELQVYTKLIRYTILISDNSNYPVPLKFPNKLELINSDNSNSATPLIRNFDNLGYKESGFDFNSNSQGILAGAFLIYQRKIQDGNYYFKITIDGISTVSINYTYIAFGNLITNDNCSLVIVNDNITTIYLNDSGKYTLKIYYLTNKGNMSTLPDYFGIFFDQINIFRIYSNPEYLIMKYIYAMNRYFFKKDSKNKTLFKADVSLANMYTGSYLDYAVWLYNVSILT